MASLHTWASVLQLVLAWAMHKQLARQPEQCPGRARGPIRGCSKSRQVPQPPHSNHGGTNPQAAVLLCSFDTADLDSHGQPHPV
jgi:hypothetical protein